MNELSKALNEVILDLDTVSNEELQAKFDASENGIVGKAIIDGNEFLRSEISISYAVSENSYDDELVSDDSDFYREDMMLFEDTVNCSLDDMDCIILKSLTDDDYLMAA